MNKTRFLDFVYKFSSNSRIIRKYNFITRCVKNVTIKKHIVMTITCHVRFEEH